MLYSGHFTGDVRASNVDGIRGALRAPNHREKTMPVLYVDIIEGRTPAEIQELLDAIHETVVEAFQVPQRDRYQVVNTHPAHEIVALDTGLGITRSPAQLVLHVVSRRRPREFKERFYQLLASNLAERCGLDPVDLIVSITENDDEDWSFGYGWAQFLTGELK
jgi:phenylpyruvate tautomerase PptA (4-oxalocrotonate tautomerase family)